jgi:hypothetical protein
MQKLDAGNKTGPSVERQISTQNATAEMLRDQAHFDE